MKETVFLIFMFVVSIMGQAPAYYPSTFWEVTKAHTALGQESYFGYIVDTADINKDNKTDILIGGWNDTYTYFGGIGVLNTQIDMMYNGRLLKICDYNGDGYNDLIAMHFTNYDSLRDDYDGELLFYYGSDTGAVRIDTIPEYSIPLPTLFPKRFGFSLNLFWEIGSFSGDFNKDGKSDLVLLQRRDTIQSSWQNGVVYIYMGREVPINFPDFRVRGKKEFDRIGSSIGIGDINGDQTDDLLVSGQINKQRFDYDSLSALYIYYGGNDFNFVDGEEDKIYKTIRKRFTPDQGWFQTLFSFIDVNGDKKKDFITSRTRAQDPNLNELNIHFGGKPEIIDTIPDLIFTDIDTTREDTFIGNIAYDAGDINMDGYNDFIVKPADWKIFSLHLGGPYINNRNPYGLRGFISPNGDAFPNYVIGMKDQSGGGVNDFLCLSMPGYDIYTRWGYAMMMYGYSGMQTSVKEPQSEKQEKSFRLWESYPNPFNPETVIRYQLSVNSKVTLSVYDILGKEITTLIDEDKEAGEYQVHFDASKYGLAGGVYLVRLTANKMSETIKIMYLK